MRKTDMDCAAACLASIAWYYGKKIPILEISEALETSKEGTSVWDVCRISEKLGLFASAYKKNIDFKEKELEVPCVAHVYQEDGLAHFIIIYKIKKNSVVIADPAVGIIEVDRKKFFNSEYGEDSPYFWTGVIILFQTTEEFYKKKEGMRIAENKFIELVKKEWKRTIYIILFSAISMAISIVSSFYFGTLIDTVIPNRLIYSLIFMTLMVILMLSLVIISLIHGKFQADKLKNQYQDGKTISTFIEEGTDTIKRQLQDLSYVNSVGEEKESGRLMNGRYSYSKCVVLDETAYEDMVKPTFVHFYGNYPEQTDEIMMSKKTLDYLGISSPKIGMKITLDFYWNDIFTTKMTGKQEFVLSGYYDSYNNELSDSSIAYICKNRIKQAGISQYPCRLWVDVKDWGLSGRQVENRLKNDINLNDKQRIISYDSAEYRAIEGTVGNYLLAYMFVLAVFFCLFLVIYNVVYISLGSDIKQYGLLRTIGATNRQIKKLVCMQIGDIYLKSCLCGVIISIVLQYCVLNNVVKNLYLGEYKANSQLKLFNLSAYIVVLVLVAITLFGATLLAVYKLTMITPIEAAKYEEVVGEQQSDYQFGKMFIIKRTGIIFGMAFRNILRYKKKFMFIIIFLAFGCEIGLLGIVVTKGTNQMNRLQKNPDFTIEVPMDTVFGLFSL